MMCMVKLLIAEMMNDEGKTGRAEKTICVNRRNVKSPIRGHVFLRGPSRS
ncbi:MAG: hypothetical protein QG657_5436 [Acidobacteriota bacterium]|nr:hypothetical protein [Acidobacteriota bacterium]